MKEEQRIIDTGITESVFALIVLIAAAVAIIISYDEGLSRGLEMVSAVLLSY